MPRCRMTKRQGLRGCGRGTGTTLCPAAALPAHPESLFPHRVLGGDSIQGHLQQGSPMLRHRPARRTGDLRGSCVCAARGRPVSQQKALPTLAGARAWLGGTGCWAIPSRPSLRPVSPGPSPERLPRAPRAQPLPLRSLDTLLTPWPCGVQMHSFGQATSSSC